MSRVLFIHGVSDLRGAESGLLLIVERLEVHGISPSEVLSFIGSLHDDLCQRRIQTIEDMMRGVTSGYDKLMSRRPCSVMGAVS